MLLFCGESINRYKIVCSVWESRSVSSGLFFKKTLKVFRIFLLAIVMKYSSIIVFLVLISSAKIFASSRPDIDTISIIGITPGTDGMLVRAHVSEKIDTLLWNQDGTGIVKFPGFFYSTKGDFRLAY